MSAITQIKVHLMTADVDKAGTDSWIYVGVGGREFLLDLADREDTHRGNDATYYFGEGTNVTDPEYNDPRKPPLDTAHLDRLPVYLRMESNGSTPGWCIEWVSVTVNPDTRDAHRFTHPSLRRVTETNRIWLDNDYGKALYLLPDDDGGSEG
ncbi:hypothetical protein C5F59_006200 [Streptomyces sp. QL37]|uniref:hypothetical protein n=1 Tax=Streptomyces sp. QL37 TaxID=2093747 RepID=UPI000CF2C525|nr:hypothetical protein [Streptomyces sp. QL37]PPQ56325.1 hypothetical protein C5F59_06280 [Streptomyces sp. QL37]